MKGKQCVGGRRRRPQRNKKEVIKEDKIELKQGDLRGLLTSGRKEATDRHEPAAKTAALGINWSGTALHLCCYSLSRIHAGAVSDSPPMQADLSLEA